jgi:hypothetical protein
MLEAYRVNRRFVWDGWIFAPKAGTHTSTFQVPEGLPPDESAEAYKQQGCWDERSVPPARYGGDIWIVQAGHPRKAAILTRNKATGDASIASPEDLLQSDEYKRLLAPPQQVARA